jgi:3-phenylpropionate/cinnamic acid dioxygenase small subunit
MVDLAAHSEITSVLHRYAFAIDDKDWEGLRSVFTVDCTADYGKFGRFDSVDAVIAWMAPVHVGLTTQHSMSNIMIDVRGQTATARSYVNVTLQPDGAPPFHAGGGYADTLVAVAGGWRIATRTYTTLWQHGP